MTVARYMSGAEEMPVMLYYDMTCDIVSGAEEMPVMLTAGAVPI